MTEAAVVLGIPSGVYSVGGSGVSFDLVRARFERLRGQPEQAMKLYRSALQYAQSLAPRWNCMLEVINKELSSKQALGVLRA